MVKHLPFSNSLTLSVSSAVSFSPERRGAEYANTIQKTVAQNPGNLAHSLRSRGLLSRQARVNHRQSPKRDCNEHSGYVGKRCLVTYGVSNRL